MKFVYEIGGNGNDGRCRFELQDMAECSYDWGCKCQDSRNNTYTCLRSVTQTEDSLFCQFSDDKNTEELYDLHTDPYQLHNLATAASADLAAHSSPKWRKSARLRISSIYTVAFSRIFIP